MMVRKISPAYLWTAFILLAVLSLFARYRGWMLPFYYPIMISMASIAAGVGILLVLTSETPWRTAGLIGTGLLIGQWWFTEQAVLILGWSIRGFAP